MAWWKEQCPGDPVDQALLYLMAILSDAGSSITHAIVQRLQLSAVQAASIEWAGGKTSRATKTLLGKDDMRPSQVYRLLMNMPDEVLVLLVATAMANRNGQKIRRLKKRLVRFLKHDRSVTTIVKGEDLKELGLKPGPHFKTILERLLNERLDGIVTTKAEERALVLRLAQRSA